MRYLLVALLFPFYAFGEVNLPLKNELIEMGVQDQNIRQEIGKAGWENAPKALLAKMSKIDQSNTDRLKLIIKKHSWLTKGLVGVEGIGAAFLIIQHSPDIEFKTQMLPHLKKSYLNDEGITAEQVALLTDRVLISQGKKQIYGTQADVVESKIVFKPIEDKANVDKRRMEMKLPPLDWYRKLLEEINGIKDHPEIEHD
jgi:hypothetical protein